MRYVDIQVNGYVGVDFNHPQTPVEEICRAASAMRADGVEWAFPTIITAPVDWMCDCIGNITAAIESDTLTGEVFRGLHVEGPFISPEAGFVGAHPADAVRQGDLDVVKRFVEASGDRIRLLTLAPEADPTGAVTGYCVSGGLQVAAGHTNATASQLDRCIDHGLSLFTHLGNGCPGLLGRHDNIILRALARRDRLRFSLIADGAHLPQLIFEHILALVSIDRLCVVSDAISAAGLGPGRFQLGTRQVEVGADGVVWDAAGEHFVGSAAKMQDAERWLTKTLKIDVAAKQRLLYSNAAQWFA